MRMFFAKIDSIDRTLFFATLLSAVMLMPFLSAIHPTPDTKSSHSSDWR